METRKQVLLPIAAKGSYAFDVHAIESTLREMGAIVITASVKENSSENLKCAMVGGESIICDLTIEESIAYDWDLIIFPNCNGDGCDYFRRNLALMSLINRQQILGKLYAALGSVPAFLIVDSLSPPTVLTCQIHPDILTCLVGSVNFLTRTDDDVVVCDNGITGVGGMWGIPPFLEEVARFLFGDGSVEFQGYRHLFLHRHGRGGVVRRVMRKCEKVPITPDVKDLLDQYDIVQPPSCETEDGEDHPLRLAKDIQTVIVYSGDPVVTELGQIPKSASISTQTTATKPEVEPASTTTTYISSLAAATAPVEQSSQKTGLSRRSSKNEVLYRMTSSSPECISGEVEPYIDGFYSKCPSSNPIFKNTIWPCLESKGWEMRKPNEIRYAFVSPPDTNGKRKVFYGIPKLIHYLDHTVSDEDEVIKKAVRSFRKVRAENDEDLGPNVKHLHVKSDEQLRSSSPDGDPAPEPLSSSIEASVLTKAYASDRAAYNETMKMKTEAIPKFHDEKHLSKEEIQGVTRFSDERFQVIWHFLVGLGWKRESSDGKNFSFFHPSNQNGNIFGLRTPKQLLVYLQTSPCWRERPEFLSAVEVYRKHNTDVHGSKPAIEQSLTVLTNDIPHDPQIAPEMIVEKPSKLSANPNSSPALLPTSHKKALTYPRKNSNAFKRIWEVLTDLGWKEEMNGYREPGDGDGNSDRPNGKLFTTPKLMMVHIETSDRWKGQQILIDEMRSYRNKEVASSAKKRKRISSGQKELTGKNLNSIEPTVLATNEGEMTAPVPVDRGLSSVPGDSGDPTTANIASEEAKDEPSQLEQSVVPAGDVTALASDPGAASTGSVEPSNTGHFEQVLRSNSSGSINKATAVTSISKDNTPISGGSDVMTTSPDKATADGAIAKVSTHQHKNVMGANICDKMLYAKACESNNMEKEAVPNDFSDLSMFATVASGAKTGALPFAEDGRCLTEDPKVNKGSHHGSPKSAPQDTPVAAIPSLKAVSSSTANVSDDAIHREAMHRTSTTDMHKSSEVAVEDEESVGCPIGSNIHLSNEVTKATEPAGPLTSDDILLIEHEQSKFDIVWKVLYAHGWETTSYEKKTYVDPITKSTYISVQKLLLFVQNDSHWSKFDDIREAFDQCKREILAGAPPVDYSQGTGGHDTDIERPTKRTHGQKRYRNDEDDGAGVHIQNRDRGERKTRSKSVGNSQQKRNPTRSEPDPGNETRIKSPLIEPALAPRTRSSLRKSTEFGINSSPTRSESTRGSSNSTIDPVFSPGKTKIRNAEIWSFLKSQGWRREERGHQMYYYPPGVTRESGKNRTDYFDSIPLSFRHVANDERFSSSEVLMSLKTKYADLLIVKK